MKEILGGKGANLAEMTSIGLPVPPGFTVTTETCAEYNTGGKLPDALMSEVTENMQIMEQETGKKFGSNTDRSGIPRSKVFVSHQIFTA